MIVRHHPLPRTADTPATTIHVDSHNSLSGRGRVLSWVVAAVLLLLCGIGIAAADALPFTGRQSVGETSTDPGAGAGPATDSKATAPGNESGVKGHPIEATWDGPAVNLDWNGAHYVRAETSFIGDRVVSPGDRVTRTLNIVNAGTSDGVLSVGLDVAADTPAGTLNPDLAEDVTLFWDVETVKGSERFSVLVPKGRVDVAEISLPKGDEIAVSIGYEMARDVETSRSLGAASTLLNFDVDLTLVGDTSAPVLPNLPATGSAGMLAILAIGLGLGMLGLLLLLIRRRRPECDDCGCTIEREDHWVKSRDSHGQRMIQCENCHLSQASLHATA